MNKKISAEKKLEKLMKTDFVGQLEDVIIFQNCDFCLIYYIFCHFYLLYSFFIELIE